jgi:hypothetical protein
MFLPEVQQCEARPACRTDEAIRMTDDQNPFNSGATMPKNRNARR